MEMLGFLCALTEEGSEGLLLISQTDNHVFIDATAFPPSMEVEAAEIERAGTLHVLGALVRTVPDAG